MILEEAVGVTMITGGHKDGLSGWSTYAYRKTKISLSMYLKKRLCEDVVKSWLSES